jgi:tetratricopeptide (TPR) repeat protein
LKINPNAPDALVNFANVLHALKRDGEALTHLDKALALRPGDQEALLYRGNALNALDRPEDAIACYDAVLRAIPRMAMLCLIAALRARGLGVTPMPSPISMRS